MNNNARVRSFSDSVSAGIMLCCAATRKTSGVRHGRVSMGVALRCHTGICEIFIQKPEVIFDDVVTNMSNQSVVKRGDVDNIIFTI